MAQYVHTYIIILETKVTLLCYMEDVSPALYHLLLYCKLYTSVHVRTGLKIGELILKAATEQVSF